MHTTEERVCRQRFSVDPLADLVALFALHEEPCDLTGAQRQVLAEIELLGTDIEPSDGKVALVADGKVALPEGSQFEAFPVHSLGASDLRFDSAGVSTSHPHQTSTPTSTLTPTTPSHLPAPHRQKPKRTPLTVEGKKARRARRTITSIIRGNHWKRASAFDKLAGSIMVAEEAGGHAFTVNLNEQRRMSLGGESPMRRVSDHLNRAFKQVGLPAPSYALRIELSPEGAPHLHGVVVTHGQDLEKIRKALTLAGGSMTGREASNQLRMKPLHHGDGWFEYLRKGTRVLDEEVWDGKLTFVSRPLQQATARAWNELRGNSFH